MKVFLTACSQSVLSGSTHHVSGVAHRAKESARSSSARISSACSAKEDSPSSLLEPHTSRKSGASVLRPESSSLTFRHMSNCSKCSCGLLHGLLKAPATGLCTPVDRHCQQ